MLSFCAARERGKREEENCNKQAADGKARATPPFATRLLSPGLLHLVEELLAVRPAPRDCGHAPAGVAQQLLVGCERQRALLEVLRVAAQREARLNVLHRRARPSLLQVVQRVLSHVRDAQ